MKKWLGLLLAVALVAGCGGGAKGTSAKAEAPKAESKPAATAQAAPAGKVLVAYYSASGNTRHVAEVIAKSTQADIFEIVPEKVYTDKELDYRDAESRVSKEHNDANRVVPLKNAKPANFDQYKTVFVAYPIWWGIAAWPVDGFIKANDFAGKTVIPVATAASSGLGQSGQLLQKMANNMGTWQEGKCFNGHYSDKTVQDWVAGLKF